jgi:hypothetical protein
VCHHAHDAFKKEMKIEKKKRKIEKKKERKIKKMANAKVEGKTDRDYFLSVCAFIRVTLSVSFRTLLLAFMYICLYL